MEETSQVEEAWGLKVCVVLGCSEWSQGYSSGSGRGCKGQSTSGGLTWGLLWFPFSFPLPTCPRIIVGQWWGSPSPVCTEGVRRGLLNMSLVSVIEERPDLEAGVSQKSQMLQLVILLPQAIEGAQGTRGASVPLEWRGVVLCSSLILG